MLCCAALAFVIGVLRALWYRLPGTGAPPEGGFAPVARWPSPDEPARPRSSVRVRLRTLLLIWTAVGMLLYALMLYVLILLGLVVSEGSGWGVWLLRDAFLAAVVVATLLAAAHLPPAGRAVSPRDVRGAWLLGAGIAWSTWSLLDMHALDLIHPAGGVVGDLVFHGFGAGLALAGAVRLANLPAAAPLAERTCSG